MYAAPSRSRLSKYFNSIPVAAPFGAVVLLTADCDTDLVAPEKHEHKLTTDVCSLLPSHSIQSIEHTGSIN